MKTQGQELGRAEDSQPNDVEQNPKTIRVYKRVKQPGRGIVSQAISVPADDLELVRTIFDRLATGGVK